MKRIVSLWLPYWPSERLIRRRRLSAPVNPLALSARHRGGACLTAVSPAAATQGMTPGMTLADARALLPELRVFPSDPVGDARALAALADWCTRFTPWAAVCGSDGVWLDVSGCSHLFGGEKALLARLVAAVRRLGFTVRAALAETPGAAWALARFAPLKMRIRALS